METPFEGSPDYREFYNHFFGDYGYYYYDDVPIEALERLSGDELIRAEELVLRAIEGGHDERPIRAAGCFRLTEAAPILKQRYESQQKSGQLRLMVVTAWALFRIENDPSYAHVLADVITKSSGRERFFDRYTALWLLPDFGKEPVVIDALSKALKDPDDVIRSAALRDLRNLYRDEPKLLDLLKIRVYEVTRDWLARIRRAVRRPE